MKAKLPMQFDFHALNTGSKESNASITVEELDQRSFRKFYDMHSTISPKP